jgi:hypothetical protein
LATTAGTEGGKRRPTLVSALVNTLRRRRRRTHRVRNNNPEPVSSVPSESATFERRIERRHIRRKFRIGTFQGPGFWLIAPSIHPL